MIQLAISDAANELHYAGGSESAVGTPGGQQRTPVIASLPGGGFVVSWGKIDNDGSWIQAKLYDAAGNGLGSEFRVNADGRGTGPAVTALASGGFAISWASDSGGFSASYDIKVQIFDSAGARIGGEIAANTITSGIQWVPTVAALSDGGFVAGWIDHSRSPDDTSLAVRAQRFDAAGNKIGTEMLVNTATTGNQTSPALAGLAGGGFIATWQDFSQASADTSSWAVKAQVFSAGGVKVGGEILVNSTYVGAQTNPSVATASNGNILIVWEDYDPPSRSIRGQLFDPAGNKVGGELVLAAGFVTYASLAAGPSGGFILSWTESSPLDESETDVFGQLLDAAGAKAGDPFLMNQTTIYSQYDSQAAVLADGTLASVWTNPSEVTLRLFGSVDGIYVLHGTEGDDDLAAPFSPAELYGHGGNDVLTGGAGADSLFGMAGNDDLRGGAGDDTLNGGDGGDVMTGGLGDDIYVVDSAADTVVENAGEGIDTVHTSLAIYSLFGTQIEQLGASSDAPHDFRGSAADNGISGGAGNDFFRLQDGGNDTALGGAGNDAFYFGGAYTADDVVDGGEGRDQVALQGNYVLALGALTSISDLILLSGTDTRFGDPGTNLYSYALTSLDSTVAAGATLLVDGTQLVAGESFTFDGSAEMDGKFILSGGDGIDVLKGGAGADGFYFRHGTFWGPNDKVTGGANDQIGFRGDFTGANKVVMGADQITGVVTLVMMSGTDTRFGPAMAPTKFDIQMHDGNVAAGQRFTIDGSFLGSDETMRIDGALETNGFFRMFGGSGADVLIGGAGNDLLRGNGAGDQLTGNGGADRFVYGSASESTGTGFDLLADFKSAEDLLDLHSAVTGWSASVGSGQLSQASFDADLAAALDGALDPGRAILFDPNAGAFAGRHFLIVDADGDGVYTAGADYVFELGASAIVDTSGAAFFV